MCKKILLIIPCYNESGSIASLLEEVDKQKYETIVIDDGSQDNTYAVAIKSSPCIQLVNNLGIGGAVQTGIKYALKNEFDYCVQVDGDGQHPPEEIYKLLELASRSKANMVIGSRYLSNDTFRSTFARRLGSRVISASLKLLFNATVSDPTSGLRLMDRKAMVFFAKNYPDDFPEPISLARLLQMGLSVCEVPVQMRSRDYGRSSISGLKSLSYMVRVLSYIGLVKLERYPK